MNAIETLREACIKADNSDVRTAGVPYREKHLERDAALAKLETLLQAAERFVAHPHAPEYLREAVRDVKGVLA